MSKPKRTKKPTAHTHYSFRVTAPTSEGVSVAFAANFTVGRHVQQHRPPNGLVDFFALPADARYKLVESLLRRETTAAASKMTVGQVFQPEFKLELLQKLVSGLYDFRVLTHAAKVDPLVPKSDHGEAEIVKKQCQTPKKPPPQPQPQPQPSLVIKEALKPNGGIKKPKKAVVAVAAKPRQKAAPAPISGAMPRIMEATVLETMEGRDLTWLSAKLITESDLRKDQNRLNLPSLQNVLTEAEKRYVEQSTRNTVKVAVVDHQGRTWNTAVRYWPSLKKYVFVEEWLKFAQSNGVQVNHLCEYWTFRTAHSDDRKQEGGIPATLGFAMNFPALVSPPPPPPAAGVASTSGGSSSTALALQALAAEGDSTSGGCSTALTLALPAAGDGSTSGASSTTTACNCDTNIASNCLPTTADCNCDTNIASNCLLNTTIDFLKFRDCSDN